MSFVAINDTEQAYEIVNPSKEEFDDSLSMEQAVSRVVDLFLKSKVSSDTDGDSAGKVMMRSGFESAPTTKSAPTTNYSIFSSRGSRASFDSSVSVGDVDVSNSEHGGDDRRCSRYTSNSFASAVSVDSVHTVGCRVANRHIGNSPQQTQGLLMTISSRPGLCVDHNMVLEESVPSMEYLCSGSNADIFVGAYFEDIEVSMAVKTGITGCVCQPATPKQVMVVVKVMKDLPMNSDIAMREFEREVNILNRIQHQNIIRLIGHGYTETLNAPFMVLEKLRGTLSEVMKSQRPFHNRPLSFGDFMTAACELASALKYIHSGLQEEITIIHRDLKPDNICFTPSGTLKLIDFGLCISIPRSSDSEDAYTMTGCTGSLRYMAKELFLGLKYNEKVDIYSFGLVLYEMATGVTPFKGFKNKAQFIEKVIDEKLRPPLDFDEFFRKIKLPKSVVGLIERCWSEDYLDRPSASVALQLLMVERDAFRKASRTVLGFASGVFFGKNY